MQLKHTKKIYTVYEEGKQLIEHVKSGLPSFMLGISH